MPKLTRWLPAILVMLIIFLFSAQPYSQQDLRPELERSFVSDSLADRLDGISFSYAGKEISVDALGGAGFIEFFIRKAAHFSVFALLGLLLVYAWNANKPFRNFFPAVLISFLYACSDEFHQGLTPGRTPLVQDVFIDTAGAICGSLLMVLLLKWSKKHRETKR